jgi:hypothetical protein
VKAVCQWLSTGLIAVFVSCVAGVGFYIIFSALDLERRFGLDAGVCLIALLVGPALIRPIHRAFHRSPKLPVTALAVGLALGVVGVRQFLRAREADAHHVPAGLFSGIEHVFAMALSGLVVLVAVLAVVAALLALLARLLHTGGDPYKAV